VISMIQRLLIAILLISFILAGPASAVKRVDKSGDQATDQKQSPNNDSQAPDKIAPPPEHHQDGDKDRFIDRDGDGINDNLKKPPETIKRKHENRSEKPDHNTKTEKSEKDRRSR
jgi:hypothetical protein